jgi:protein-disulfide isomerase
MPPAHHPDSPDSRARTRAYRLGGLLVTVAAIAAVLVALVTSGSTSQLAPGKPVPGARQTLAVFAGVPQHGIGLGDPRAPVTLVEFGDLQCPACSEFATAALPAVVSRYVRSGRVMLEFRALDLIGADSVRAAAMAAALSQQDRMWQFIELAYRNQGLENTGYVTDTYLRALASAIPGIDLARALAARTAPAARAQLDEARALARQAGVRATPWFLISRSGQPLRRFSPPGLDRGSFTHALDAALVG